MSKSLTAVCTGKVVLVNGVPVPVATIVSEGVGPSQGVLILDEENAWYLTSNASDLKTTLDTVSSTLSKIASTLTTVGAFMTGPTTAPPPTLAADVAEIMANAAILAALKEVLK